MKNKFEINWERLIVWSAIAFLVVYFWYSAFKYLLR